jgi:hypothetical protein
MGMQRLRRVSLALLTAVCLAGLPACNSDDAKSKANEAGNKAEKAGKKAKKEAEKAKKDVDGQ